MLDQSISHETIFFQSTTCIFDPNITKNHLSGTKYLGGGNCNQGLYNPNWQDMDLQSFVLKSDTNYFQQPVKQANGRYVNYCWGAESKQPKAGQLITLSPCTEGTAFFNFFVNVMS